MTASSEALPQLFELLVELTAGLKANDRFAHLIEASGRLIPCDAIAVLRLQEEGLVPIAQHGLKREVLGKRFRVEAHPRFARILGNPGVTRFESDSTLADPYDGLVESIEGPLPVHSCMGAPLYVDDVPWGLMTFDALQPGAFDAIDDDVVLACSRIAAAIAASAVYIGALEQEAAQEHAINANLLQQVLPSGSGQLIGASDAMQSLQREIDLVASSDLAVLITGETGVGKELVARALHARSDRAGQPMVYLNCASLPDTLVESELFGHRKGAFTGAVADYRGKFQLADGGSLFLDEMGELPLASQAKLLRVLQSGEVQPLGSEQQVHVDVRIIAATNRDLTQSVKEGAFRADLFHRLSVYPIRVPPLREREGDLPLLVGHFIEKQAAQLGVSGVSLGRGAQRLLASYPWPGNVRELEHVVSRALLRLRADQIDGPRELTPALLGLVADDTAGSESNTVDEALAPAREEAPLAELVDAFKAKIVEQRLARYAGNWSKAAASLGVHRSNLHRLARRLGIG